MTTQIETTEREVILVEDVRGKGHLSKAVDGKLRNCIFIPVD